MIITHNDPRLSWHGHVSLEQTTDYTRPWRIPFEQKVLFYPDLTATAGTQAGIRLAFRSNTRHLSGAIVPFEGAQNIDLYVDGALFGTADFADKSTLPLKIFPLAKNYWNCGFRIAGILPCANWRSMTTPRCRNMKTRVPNG